MSLVNKASALIPAKKITFSALLTAKICANCDLFAKKVQCFHFFDQCERMHKHAFTSQSTQQTKV